MKFIPILLISLFFVISLADNENQNEGNATGFVRCTPTTCCNHNDLCCEHNRMCCMQNAVLIGTPFPC
ncbi:unnamed protein product [Nezara viridula]|uniref:Cysteine rich secreted protein n=1 Tax=Nezara viridula TaxID=85310 RepID=A0A9P0GY14_NEZVI|nr:unnamed protein product [Nezara viridula]